MHRYGKQDLLFAPLAQGLAQLDWTVWDIRRHLEQRLPPDIPAAPRKIAEALITTAAGLTVAIPALIGYRYYRNRVDTLVVSMEKEAIKLVEALHRRQQKGS